MEFLSNPENGEAAAAAAGSQMGAEVRQEPSRRGPDRRHWPFGLSLDRVRVRDGLDAGQMPTGRVMVKHNALRSKTNELSYIQVVLTKVHPMSCISCSNPVGPPGIFSMSTSLPH